MDREIDLIEALHHSEARYLAIIEDQTELICRYLPDGHVSFVNEAYLRYFGKRRQDVLGMNFIPHIPEADLAVIKDSLAKITLQTPIIEIEHRVIMPDGVIRFQRWTHRGIYSREGGLLEYQAVGHDITERKQAEERLQHSLREKEILLKEIHHRVKNNLQVVCSLLSLQAKRGVPPETRAILEASRDRVLSIALIHKKLYQSSDLAYIDYREYLRSLLTEIAATYKQPTITWSVEMERLSIDVNVAIPCGLIVNELFSNSLKHAFPNGKSGTIRVGLVKTQQEYVLTVADDGIGMPSRDFFRMSSLGLQLVHVLAKQINGTITYSNERGATFRVTFPAVSK